MASSDEEEMEERLIGNNDDGHQRVSILGDPTADVKGKEAGYKTLEDFIIEDHDGLNYYQIREDRNTIFFRNERKSQSPTERGKEEEKQRGREEEKKDSIPPLTDVEIE